MCEGYSSRSVCLSVSLSITTLGATYLVIGEGAIRLLVAILTNEMCGIH